MSDRRALLISVLCAVAGAASAGFQDPLDTRALAVRNPALRSLFGIDRAGSRLFAVGMRGLVLVSDDGGRDWRQVAMPLSSDLVSVRFRSATDGWLTGHDGVIMSTTDAGLTWRLQLDGRRMGRLLTEHFERAAAQGQPRAEAILDSVRQSFAAGPEQPILGVWFDDADTGWAVSTFGTVLGTTDGGNSWTSWIERVDNPDLLHCYSINGVGGDVFITAERGKVFKLDRVQQRFVCLNTGYQGGLFGLVGSGGALLVYGLQGNALRSRDGGASWEPLNMVGRAGLNAAAVFGDGRVAMVSQDGRLLITADQGSTFEVSRLPRPGLLTGVVAQDRALVVVGFNGVQRISL